MAKRDVRFFNNTGPCNPNDHYMLPPEDRLVGAQLHRYMRDKLYWVLHAPRQTGKTTFLQSRMKRINEGGEAVACYVSIETCQGIENIEDAMTAASNAIRFYADVFGLPVPTADDCKDPLSGFSSMLGNWAKIVAPKPLIILFDEVLEEGLEQIQAYRDKFSPSVPSYLLIFDRRTEAKQRPWSERLTRTQNNNITILTL